MKKSQWLYWTLQVAGWGSWILLNIFFSFSFSQDYFQGERGQLFLFVLLIQFCWYILATHLLRAALHKIAWIQLPMNKVIVIFMVGVFLTGAVSYFGANFTASTTGVSLVKYERNQSLQRARTLAEANNLTAESFRQLEGLVIDSATYTQALRIRRRTGWAMDANGEWKYENQYSGRFWWDFIFSFILIALWLSIYMAWHYFQKSQQDKLDRLQLEKTVKELELRTIKSHINPHFIFNSLNSIRALVEEDPKRARGAITELSNILRSSLRMEKLETIPLERELNIVKDYLALEQVRFEERLKVHFDINEDTLQQAVPPMMIQTLVENAIKHGISKEIDGGVINISTGYKESKFELVVENTGHLEEGKEGFGITSTRNRLRFLHNGNAVFNIANLANHLVRVQVVIPATQIEY